MKMLQFRGTQAKEGSNVVTVLQTGKMMKKETN